MERWDGRENDLAVALETERVGYQAAARDGDFDTAVVWAGEAVDLIDSVEGAAALVAHISAEAEAQLRAGAKLARQTPATLSNDGQSDPS
jgi:nitronate monooxygenase